jgi:hypothetical protein
VCTKVQNLQYDRRWLLRKRLFQHSP